MTGLRSIAVLAALMVIAGLSGCNPTAQQAKQVVVSCGHVMGLTAEQQKAVADELDRLAPDSIIANLVIPDWIRQRDEARACAGKVIGKVTK